MPKANVLYVTASTVFDVWDTTIISVVGNGHDLRVFDWSKPAAPQFKGVDVVVDMGGHNGTHELMDLAVDARVWQIMSSGYEHFDVEYARSKGIPVANTPGPCSGPALAETAMMFMLMLARRYKATHQVINERRVYLPMGTELGGKILTIVGFGASGQALARLGKSHGMRVQAIDVVTPSRDALDEIRPEFVGTPDDLETLLRETDYVSLHLHVKPDTERLLDERRIGLMKPTACIINVARGALIDQDAMFAALLAGRLGGAGLDVFAKEPVDPDEPALQLPNVICTPHIAGVTQETARRRAETAAENASRVADGLDPINRVDL